MDGRNDSNSHLPTPISRAWSAPSPRARSAQSWWARRWVEALEALGWGGRLQRGRSYARAGAVRSIDVRPGRVTARVKGSRPQPYTVRVELPVVSDEAWGRVVEALSGQARYAASLLAGEMPPDIDEVFAEQGVHLFPQSEDELTTDCSCPDWANPCKHVAAVHYVLGAEFDRDPFLLFRLRGRTREAIVAALRASRVAIVASGTSSVEAESEGGGAEPPLEAQIERFWTLGEEFGGLRFAVERPRVAEAVLKRLGSPAVPGEGELPAAELARFYRSIGERAIRSAYESGEG